MSLEKKVDDNFTVTPVTDNCFECNGHNYRCVCYIGGDNYPMCVYKDVANNDLMKAKQGREDLTLIDMYNAYQKRQENA